jgi:chitodextrinase
MQPSAATLQIGRESASYKQYSGGLDEIRMWSILRTQTQIQAHMSSELSGIESGLVAYWKLNEGSGITISDSSTGGNMATAYNGTTWTAGGNMQPPVIDTTPPVISGVLISALTDTTVTITFSTSERATGWVSYTSGSACPCIDVNSQGPGTAHTVQLTGLSPDDTYVYQPKATDAAGNLGLGPTLQFTTLPPAPDQTPPTISLTSPTTTTVAGTVAVAATATDNVAVIGVQFKLDGTNLEAEDTTAPYSISWNTTGVGDGPHTLTAEARDAAGNVGSSLMALTVANQAPPSTPYFLSFDGVDDYAQVAGPLNLSFGNGTSDTPFTIETWIRPTNVALKQNLIGRWGGDNASQEYKLCILGSTIRIDLRDSSRSAVVSAYVNGDLTALNGAWHHIAVTYDGRGGATAANGITIYIDGVPATLARQNSAAYVAMQASTATLQIGHESNSWRQYVGGLDEIRMWNIVRTQAQIQTQMSSAIPPSETGLVAYWRFNEGTGVAAADSSLSGSNLATLFNGPAWNAGGH